MEWKTSLCHFYTKCQNAILNFTETQIFHLKTQFRWSALVLKVNRGKYCQIMADKDFMWNYWSQRYIKEYINLILATHWIRLNLQEVRRNQTVDNFKNLWKIKTSGLGVENLWWPSMISYHIVSHYGSHFCNFWLLLLSKMTNNIFFCSLNIFWRTLVLLVETLTPLFWTSSDVFPGFQSEGESLACVLHYVHCTKVLWMEENQLCNILLFW